MVATLADRTDASADASAALAAEALIEEARRRQRKRWGGWIAAFAALALVVGVLVAVFGGTGGGRGATAGGSDAGQPFGTCSPCTPQSSASALARGHWVSLPPAPIVSRIDEAAVWTGHQLVIWGGAGRYDNVTYGDGAAYDPTTRQWRMLPASPLGPRWGVAAVWTGKDVFVWGGTGSGTGWTGPTLRDGALYDPTAHRWTLVPPAPIPARKGATAIWTGHEVVIFGGRGTGNVGWLSAQRTDGAAYDPTTGRWQRLPPLPEVDGEQGVMADQIAWNGQAVVATAVAAQHAPSMPLDGYRPTALSARWTPGALRWHLLPSPPSLAKAFSMTAVWTGTRFVYLRNTCRITGGDAFCAYHRRGSAGAFDPETGATMSLSRSVGLAYDGGPGIGAWTGRAVLAVAPQTGQAAAYDPAAHRWRRLPATPSFDAGATSVWTGHELIVWGGVYRTPVIPGRALVAG